MEGSATGVTRAGTPVGTRWQGKPLMELVLPPNQEGGWFQASPGCPSLLSTISFPSQPPHPSAPTILGPKAPPRPQAFPPRYLSRNHQPRVNGAVVPGGDVMEWGCVPHGMRIIAQALEADDG